MYQVEFTRALLRGINVGDLKFSARPAASDGQLLKLVGDASAKGFLLRLFGSQFHLHVESSLDSESLAAMRTKKVEENGKRVRISEALFDHSTRKVTWTERDPNSSNPPNITTVEFKEPIQDILTVIYYMRTQRLEVGQSFEVPLLDNGHLYRCVIAVVERKKIRSALGRINAVRVEPAIFSGDRVVRSRGTLSIWVSDDSRRIPVKAQVKVPLGTFDIKLKRLKYDEPLS